MLAMSREAAAEICPVSIKPAKQHHQTHNLQSVVIPWLEMNDIVATAFAPNNAEKNQNSKLNAFSRFQKNAPMMKRQKQMASTRTKARCSSEGLCSVC